MAGTLKVYRPYSFRLDSDEPGVLALVVGLPDDGESVEGVYKLAVLEVAAPVVAKLLDARNGVQGTGEDDLESLGAVLLGENVHVILDITRHTPVAVREGDAAVGDVEATARLRVLRGLLTVACAVVVGDVVCGNLIQTVSDDLEEVTVSDTINKNLVNSSISHIVLLEK